MSASATSGRQADIQREQSKRFQVHYDTLPHGKNCIDPERCDCDCHGCVHARGGVVVDEKNRAQYVKDFGLPKRYLCAKDNYQIPEAY